MSETIGDKLKQAREARRLTLDDVTKATRIRTHYLEALERGDLSAIPSAAQARGFLRLYAGFLGLDPDSLVPVKAPEPEPASSLDVQPAPASETAPQPGPPRPSFLMSLRERFTRRAESEKATPAEAPKPESAIQPPAPGPEPFVPVRYTEELPAEPAPSEPAPVKEPTSTTSRRKTTPRKNGTKSSAKRVKLLDSVEGENTEEVKKKLAAARPSWFQMKRE